MISVIEQPAYKNKAFIIVLQETHCTTELSNLWKIPTPEGHNIPEPFGPEELAAALRRLKPGKSPGVDYIFLEFILHDRSALKSWFFDSLTSCMRQLKIPISGEEHMLLQFLSQKSHWGAKRAIVPYLCCASSSKPSRDSSTLV